MRRCLLFVLGLPLPANGLFLLLVLLPAPLTPALALLRVARVPTLA